MNTVFSTERLNACNATKNDIDIILKLENDKLNRKFVWQGTYEEHVKEIYDNEHLLLVCKNKADNRIIGYSLCHIDNKSEVFELRRIVVDEKGKGFGKEILVGLMKYCFEELKLNRFWLDVYPDNEIGIKLYTGVGMHHDGTLRQSYKSERGYLDQMIFSMLKSEYFKN